MCEKNGKEIKKSKIIKQVEETQPDNKGNKTRNQRKIRTYNRKDKKIGAK